MTIKPINWFILLKQKIKQQSVLLWNEVEKCENEFEVIDFDFNPDSIHINEYEKIRMSMFHPWQTVIKWPHSGDKITVDNEEYWMIKPEHLLAFKI